MGSVVIAAALAQRPSVGGHTWFALQYLLGFRKLGWDVLLVDRLDAGMCRDRFGAPCPPQGSANLAYLEEVMERFEMAERWSVLLPDGEAAGLPRAEVERRVASSDLLLNVMGYLDDEALLAASPLRVFLDIDPGFAQMWQELGQADLLSGHDRFVSVGLNVGGDGCGVPDCGIPWITTPPPVALDHWPVAPGGTAFTTVASWRGPYDAVEYEGHTYGLRVHEFRRFAELPRRTAAKFEIALSIDASESADLRRLSAGGWALLDPVAVAGDPFAYNRFIQGSGAEFTVAKGMYVDTRSGWFSDRSACYLASGKPVIAQDTGFSAHLPTGKGLLPFTTPDEALGAVEEARADPAGHRRAAREIAEEHLDASRVLPRLIDQLGAVGAGV
ncbi:MAG TPA: hypothetical protein VIY71_03220 [Solirubrobacterales bacterium]